LRDNLIRLDCGAAEVACHDWTAPAPAHWLGAFDAILADVPCSNTGVLRRRVDVRWRLQPRQIGQLVALQRRIVVHLLPCLKPGGRLVYSTCSLEAEENQQQVEALLAVQPELRLAGIREALPQRDATDGAFAALFRFERGAAAR
jgi:16S rRNA (cytosine967-C5)-methyltransferase